MGAQWLTPTRAFVAHSTCQVVVLTRKLEVVAAWFARLCQVLPKTQQLETTVPSSRHRTLEVSLRVLFIQKVLVYLRLQAPTQVWASRQEQALSEGQSFDYGSVVEDRR